MITDNLLRFSEEQAVTVTAISENVVDQGARRDVGEGQPLYVVFTINETFAALTSLTIDVDASAEAALTASTSIGNVVLTLAQGELDAGKQYFIQIRPQSASIGQQYLGVTYTVEGSAATAGKITADIVLDIQDGLKHYPSGFTVA